MFVIRTYPPETEAIGPYGKSSVLVCAAVTKYARLCGLQGTEIVLPQGGAWEVRDQGVSRFRV
jgi:hypothetical protein